MASVKTVALALAVSVFGVSIVASTAHADTAKKAPANQGAAAKDKKSNRNEYLIKVMTNQGFSDAKAKRVIAAITRYETDFRKTHKDIASQRALLRDDKPANDKAAQTRIDADKKKLDSLKARYKAEISKILTAPEQNKLAQILAPPAKPKKGKGHQKHKPKKHPEKKT
jgi:hypothetical protein